MASGVFLSFGKGSPFFVPMAEDGRFATYDTRTDPYLTPSPASAVAYPWRSVEAAEAQIDAFEQTLGVSFHVESAGSGA